MFDVIARGPGGYVASGSLTTRTGPNSTSTEGATWTSSDLLVWKKVDGVQFSSFASSATAYVGSGAGVFTSTDGVTWREVRRFGETESGRGIALLGEGFVVVGSKDAYELDPSAMVWTVRLGPVAAGAATVSAAWSAKIGSAGVNGKATISASTTGSGTITLKLAKLKASTLHPVVLHKGTCSSVGAVLLTLPPIRTTRTGSAARTSSLTAAQVSKITLATAAGPIAIRIGSGSARKCGAFSQSAIQPYVVATITVGGSPVDVAIAPNGVWVTNWNDNTLSRIDPATSQVLQTLPLTLTGNAGPFAIAFGDGSLWVTTTIEWDDSDNLLPASLVRVNPVTGQQQATVPIGRGAYDVEVSPGAVWVTAYEDNAVLRVDTATNTVAATIPVPGRPVGVAFGAGSLWVSSEDGKVARIDPATNSIVTTIQTQDTGGYVAFGGGAVWVTNAGYKGQADGMLTRIDPATNGVTASVTVGTYPWSLAYAGGSVWVGLRDTATVVRVSATTNAVLNRVTVDDNVDSIAATDHAVWAVHPDPKPGVVTRIAY
jgi:YVTN family beta-propeller protein